MMRLGIVVLLVVTLCIGTVSAGLLEDLFPTRTPTIDTPLKVAITPEDLNPVVYNPTVEKEPIIVVGTKMILTLGEKEKPVEILQVSPEHPSVAMGDGKSAVSVIEGIDLAGRGAINLRFRVGDITVIIRRGAL